jgi:hypothetical protein
MQIVLGPVRTRKGGYAFDCWTPEEGLSRGYIYGRIEDAHYAPISATRNISSSMRFFLRTGTLARRSPPGFHARRSVRPRKSRRTCPTS